MFKDYYLILDIKSTASLDEVKAAFRVQAIKWHPDRNLNVDTTSIMQEINEAYLILKDTEARIKYDIEYLKFKSYFNNGPESTKESNGVNDYKIVDIDLEKWIKNAQRQSINLAKQTIIDFKGITRVAIKEGYSASKNAFIYYLIASIIISILVKSCM